jgi:hypothetical protein
MLEIWVIWVIAIIGAIVLGLTITDVVLLLLHMIEERNLRQVGLNSSTASSADEIRESI